MSIEDRIKNSKTFCVLPFIHFATKTDGDIKLCCRSWPMGNFNDSSIKEVWNSDGYKEVRRQLLDGERPKQCDACWRHEDINVSSMRQRVNKDRLERYMDNVKKVDPETYEMPFEIPIIEAKLSNFCNLKCRMCHPLDSTSWAKDWGSIEHLMQHNNESTYTKVKMYGLTKKPYMNAWEDKESFWKELEEIAPFLDKIEFAGGEPLIDPMHYKVLNVLKKHGHRIMVKYSTNLTNLNYKKQSVLELWNHFKSVNVIISIDGVYDTYDYIRQGAEYETIKSNIKIVKAHPKVQTIMGAFTLQIYNASNLIDTIIEFEEELGIRLHTHRVNYPRFLDVRVMPRSLRENLVKELEVFSMEYSDNPNIVKHVRDAINTLLGGDMEQYLPEFIEFSDTLDMKQRVKKPWRDLMPELSQHIEAYLHEKK